MTRAGHPPRDPGLPAERTVLAWQRTGLASAGLSGIALLGAAHDGSLLLLAVVAVLAAACTAAGAVAARPPRPSGPDGSAHLPSPWTRIVSAALAAGLLSATGLVLVAAATLG